MSLFIEKDNRVEMGLSTVIPYLSFARVIRVLEITSEGGGKTDGFRRGCRSGDRRLVLCKANWFITVNAVFAHVGFSEV